MEWERPQVVPPQKTASVGGRLFFVGSENEIQAGAAKAFGNNAFLVSNLTGFVTFTKCSSSAQGALVPILGHEQCIFAANHAYKLEERLFPFHVPLHIPNLLFLSPIPIISFCIKTLFSSPVCQPQSVSCPLDLFPNLLPIHRLWLSYKEMSINQVPSSIFLTNFGSITPYSVWLEQNT